MLTDITLGQYFPGTSFLHRLDAGKNNRRYDFHRRHLFGQFLGVLRYCHGFCGLEFCHFPTARPVYF
mgnify:CR=1 FL=1